jgi:putative transposase
MMFDLETAKQIEAKRRLSILGNLIEIPPEELQDKKKAKAMIEIFKHRRWETGIPMKFLSAWYLSYQASGFAGLLPTEWEPLTKKEQRDAAEKYDVLGIFADQLIIDDLAHCLEVIAKRAGRSTPTARRWLTSYRTGGLWGLTARFNPQKKIKKPREQHPDSPDIGSLDGKTLQTIYERREILGDLPGMSVTTEEDIAKRAGETGKSPRTIWNYLTAYRKWGLAGLAPKKRRKKSQLSEFMINAIVGLRLAHKNSTLKSVTKKAIRIALANNEDIPSEYQVKEVCRQIPEPQLLLATGQHDEFRNKFQITFQINISGVVYQIDHTQIDVLAHDIRQKRARKKSGQVRLWLTTCMEMNSRTVVAWHFSYDRPNRHTVASVIRQAILNRPGGIPDEIWVDNGKDLVSNHVKMLCRELGITLHICTPGQPQLRGRDERFFGTLNTRLWKEEKGYVGSSVADRPPDAKADSTPEELIKRFEELLHEYHHEPHSSLGMSPHEYWQNNCSAEPIDNERTLDLLMLEAKKGCTVSKKGIRYASRIYWHSELARLVGEKVLIRADTRFAPPDEIEVFHEETHVCTAFATDSEKGKAVTPEMVNEAKKAQRRELMAKAQDAKQVARDAEKKIEKENFEEKQSGGQQSRIEQNSDKPSKPNVPPPSSRLKDEDDFLLS